MALKLKNNFQESLLINKTIFFPKQGILAIGDLHLGYETMLREQGISLPFNQIKTTKKQIEEIIKEINSNKYRLKKIILLGDIKHYFKFQKSEYFEIRKFKKFLEKFVPKKNIILIRGNHDKAVSKKEDYRDFYISEDKKIAFLHGHKSFPEIKDNKKIKTLVMSHIHHAINIKDPNGIKMEKYKAFLIGKYNSKRYIVVPSFFPLIEGSEINEFYSASNNFVFSIVPYKKLMDFQTFIVGKIESMGLEN